MLDGRTRARFRAQQPGLELTLVRRYRQSAERVFAALSVPERIAAWMRVTWLGDPAPLKVGSNFSYRFADSAMDSVGHVTAFEPGRLIAHTWFENMPPAQTVTWRLEPEGEGCLLTLTQATPSHDDGPRNGAGWTMIIGQLDAWLSGETFQPKESWRSLRDRYAQEMGPRATRDGRRFDEDGRPVVRFTRLLDMPVQDAWAWLTEPEKLARWLGDVDVDLRPGGVFRIAFQMEAAWMNGTVLAVEPPRRLSVIWREPWFEADDVVLEFALAPDADGTLLTLTHTFPRGYDPHEYLPGWHEFLDLLEEAIAGHPTPEWSSPERARRWETLKTIYKAVAGAGG